MSALSRRLLVTSAAALPALAVPAVAIAAAQRRSSDGRKLAQSSSYIEGRNNQRR